MELMAKVFVNLYYEIQEVTRINEKLLEMNKGKDEVKLVLGIPDVMKLMGIGRGYAEKIMWGGYYFSTVQIENRK